MSPFLDPETGKPYQTQSRITMEELGKLTHFFVSVDEQRMVAIFENGGCSEIIKNGMTTKQVSQALRTLADRIDQWKDHDEHHA